MESEKPETEALKRLWLLRQGVGATTGWRSRKNSWSGNKRGLVAEGRSVILDMEITNNVDKSSLSGSEPGAKIMEK